MDMTILVNITIVQGSIIQVVMMMIVNDIIIVTFKKHLVNLWNVNQKKHNIFDSPSITVNKFVLN